MTFSLPRTVNLGAIAAAFAYSSLTIGALAAPTPAAAQGDTSYYTATLAKPADKRVNIAGGLAWKCTGTACVAAKGTSRPARVCADLNRELGTVTAFSAKGEALAEDALAQCND